MVGRIVCDSDAKLNENSVLLESSRSIGSGARVASTFPLLPRIFPFSWSNCRRWRVNPDGNCLHVTRFFNPPIPVQNPKSTANLRKLSENFPDAVMSVIVASGPFTLDSRSDLKELDYSPWFTFIRSLLKTPWSFDPLRSVRRFGKFFFAGWAACWNAWSNFRTWNHWAIKRIETKVLRESKLSSCHHLKICTHYLDFIYPQSPLQFKTVNTNI